MSTTDSLTYFSIVIEDVPDYPDIENWIQPRVHKLNNDGTPLFTASSDPITEYHNDIRHGQITENIVISWTTPLYIYQNIQEHQKKYIDHIKKFINKTKCMISYHDGESDQACKFHSRHYHIMTRLTTNERHIHHNYAYNTLMKNIPTIKSEKVKLPPNFAQYMTKSPKKCLGTNDQYIRDLFMTKQSS